MPSSCVFELNSPQATYFSGETISGTIYLHTDNAKNVRDVSIIFSGEGKVKWEESHSTTNSDGSSSTSTTYYRSHEVYVNNCTRVWGEGTLPAGRHTYTFSIPLPLECPTSLEGKYGHVRYEIILKLNRYYRFDNVYKKPVTIIKTVDLNYNSFYKMPVVAECLKSLCCWPCSNGNIIATLKIPFGAYAPGQMLKYSLHIVNQSMSDVEGYTVEFTKKIIFTAKTPSHKQRRSKDILVKEGYREQCLRLTNRVIENQIYIPSTPPSTDRSNIICVEYKLKIVLQLSGCSSNGEIEVPIVIGTVPIRESLAIDSNMMTHRQIDIVPTAPEEPQMLIPGMQGPAQDLPPSYNEIKPPTFEEATGSGPHFVDTDTDERNRIVGFKPLYPIYRK